MLACFRGTCRGQLSACRVRPGSDTTRPSRRCGPQVDGEVGRTGPAGLHDKHGGAGHRASSTAVSAASCLGPFGRHLAVGADTASTRRWAAGGAGGQCWGGVGVRTLRLDPHAVRTPGSARGPCTCSLSSGPARWLLETNGRAALFPLRYCAPLGMSGRLMRWVLVGPNPASFRASVRSHSCFLAGFRASVLDSWARRTPHTLSVSSTKYSRKDRAFMYRLLCLFGDSTDGLPGTS